MDTDYRRRTVLKGLTAATGLGLLGSGWAATHPDAAERHWDHIVGGEPYAEIDHEQRLEDRYDAWFQFADTDTLEDHPEPVSGLADQAQDAEDCYVAVEFHNMGLSGATYDLHLPAEERVYGQRVEEIDQGLLDRLADDSTERYTARWVGQLLEDAYGG